MLCPVTIDTPSLTRSHHCRRPHHLLFPITVDPPSLPRYYYCYTLPLPALLDNLLSPFLVHLPLHLHLHLKGKHQRPVRRFQVLKTRRISTWSGSGGLQHASGGEKTGCCDTLLKINGYPPRDKHTSSSVPPAAPPRPDPTRPDPTRPAAGSKNTAVEILLRQTRMQENTPY